MIKKSQGIWICTSKVFCFFISLFNFFFYFFFYDFFLPCIPEAFLLKIQTKTKERIFFLPLLFLFFSSIDGGIIGRSMNAEPIRHSFDKRSPFSSSCSVQCFRSCTIHRKKIIPIDLNA